MLALTGNTGPYLQYATARIRSIFRRAGLEPGQSAGPIQLTEDAERALALAMLGFGSVVGQAAQTAEPHLLAAFLFDVASAFTTFYEQCRYCRPLGLGPPQQARAVRPGARRPDDGPLRCSACRCPNACSRRRRCRPWRRPQANPGSSQENPRFGRPMPRRAGKLGSWTASTRPQAATRRPPAHRAGLGHELAGRREP